MTTSRARQASGRLAPTAAPLLDARAAADHLGVSVAMLRSATAAGEIAHVRLRCRGSGARDAVRWLVDDLDAWVLAHRVPAAAPGPAPGVHTSTRLHPGAPLAAPRAFGSRARAAPLLSAREVLRGTGTE